MSYESVQEMFSRMAAEHGDRTAIDRHGRSVSYAELEAQSNRLANFLLDGGVSTGTMVGLFTDDPIRVITGILGVLKAGAVFVPLDPTFPDQRLRTMSDQVQPFWYVTEDRHLEKLDSIRENKEARIVYLEDLPGRTEHPGLISSPEAPCSIYFTSGSTGKPKAILGRLKGIDHFMRWEIEAVQAGVGTRVSQLASPSFDGFLKDAFVPLCSGGVVCAPESRDILFDAWSLADWLDMKEVEVLHCVPSLFRALLNEGLTNRYFEGMKYVVMTGEPLYPADVKRWLDIFGDRIKLLNIYGTTETSLSKFQYEVKPEDVERPSIPVGRPIKGAAALIMDAALQPCHEGAVGEIYIRTPYRSYGYYGEPELTKEVFIQNPFSDDPNDVVHKTGDYGRLLEDGLLEILGRRDQQVKVRGVRVELGEIENLLRTHDAIEDVAVVDREDAQGNKFLVAYVTLVNGSGTDEIRNYLAERLPPTMLPSAFVELEELPRTLNGKIDRKALPALELIQVERDAGELVPRTPVEEIVAGIWCEVLRLPEVGRTDNFFNLGGHSLLATQVILRIRDTLSVELPVRAMFEASTVAGLSHLIQEEISEGRESALAAIEPVSRDGELPLSFAQQRMWFQEELAHGTTTFHIPLRVRLSGPVNIAALEQSFSEIVRRHENLRTSFPIVNGQLVQVLAPPSSTVFPIVDMRNLHWAEQETVGKAIADAELNRPFDLETGPLARVGLIRHADDDYTLSCTLHHIICDGWSRGLLIREVSALYEAYSKGLRSPLAELPIQYADFAAWQREQLQGDVLEKDLAYWRENLADAPPLLQLPTDRPRPPVQTYRGAMVPVFLSQQLHNDLKALSRQQGVTLFMTLLAAFQTLLYRYTAQADVVVGTTIANRERSDIEGLIGFFGNRLVLRTDCSGNPRFEELLSKVRETTLKAYSYQTLPFEKLLQELQPKRNPSYTPLFQVILSLQNLPTLTDLTLSGLTLSFPPFEVTTSECDLLLDLSETSEGMFGALQYNPDLFDQSTIVRFGEHFRTLLEGIVARPEERLHELPLLSEPERLQALMEWNATEMSYPLGVCVHDLFDRQVDLTPDAVAVSCEGEQLTYAQLQRRANQLAHYLLRTRVEVETPVALYLDRSLEMIVGLLGVLKAGGAYVPLETSHPKGRVRYMLENSGAQVVLTQQRLQPRLPEVNATVVCLDADWPGIAAEPETSVMPRASAENLAYIIYTSGSTGSARGVMVQHRSVINLAATLQANVYGEHQQALRVSVNAPLLFDSSVKQVVQLLFGHELCIVPEAVRRDGERLLSYLRREAVDVLDCTPSQLRLLLASGLDDGDIRLVLIGGEAIDDETWQMLAVREQTTFYNVYGPTECTVDATVAKINGETAGPSLGRPLGNVQTYVLDQQRQPVAVGVRAELCIGGAGVARGYLNEPELSATRFVPDAFSGREGARLYRSGDLARQRANGEIEFLGRLDYQVKIRGHRIEPGEVEAALRKEPQLKEAVVVERDDANGGKRLVAYIVPAEDAASIGDLQRSLKENLPDYMIPTGWVVLDQIPLTPNGKVDRAALPIPAEGYSRNLANAYEEPQTEIEVTLATIWRDVLHTDQVGIYDDFFELGGHSLIAIQIVHRINQSFELELPIRSIFDEPNIAGLSLLVEETLIGNLEETPEPASLARVQAN